MRFASILFFLLLLTTGFAQQPIQVSISGTIFNAPGDTIELSQFFGTHYKDYATIKLNKKGEFSFKGTVPAPDYYAIRVGQTHLNVILRNNSDIKIYGDGKNIGEYTNIVGSEETAHLNEFLKDLNAWAAKRDSASRILQQYPERQEEVNSSMTREFYTFQGKVQSFVQQNPNSAALLPVLSTLDASNDFTSYEAVVKQLQQGFGESPSVQNIYASYLQLKKQKEEADFLAPGKTAPDFEELKLDRTTTMKLSDLHGKVVLLDFWASWCGPCRRENPNVVKMYEKYKKDGFTVMSVSLDKDLNAWKAAIEKDGLSWPNHVSDLKQWSSKVAQIYGVRGIPFTVLIDKEGKIIRTNVRGADLENELIRIFGH